MIFEARAKKHKGCANSINLEWRAKKTSMYGGSLSRDRRDVRDATKYIETALVLDKAMASALHQSLLQF
jgi:hypothetical protein